MKHSRETAVALALLVAALSAAAIAPAAADKVTIINNYGATPFVYGGYTYVPLRAATDFIGAALLWDSSLKGRAAITFNGREVGLVIGSPYVLVGGSQVALPAAPVVVGGQVFVPSVVFSQYLQVPVVYDSRVRVLRIQRGPAAWGTFKVGRVPPGFRKARGQGERGQWKQWRPQTKGHARQFAPYSRGPAKARAIGHGKGHEKGQGKGPGKGQGKGHGRGRGGKD